MKKKSHNMIAIHQNVRTISSQETTIRNLASTYQIVFRIKSTIGLKYNPGLGILKSYNQRLRNLTDRIQTLDLRIRKMDVSSQKNSYPQILDIRNETVELYTVLESSKFFGIKETEELADKLLDHSFELESYIRYNALDYIRTPEDEALEKWASELSLNSAFSILSENI